VYKTQGDYPRALEHYNRALVIKEVVLGKNHKTTANTCYNLVLAYNNLGNMTEAVCFMERARTAYSSIYGEDHRDEGCRRHAGQMDDTE